MLPPPVAQFGWDHLHLPSNPWDWPREEPSLPLGSLPAGGWHNSCLGFHYVKVLLLLSPTLPETLAFDHLETNSNQDCCGGKGTKAADPMGGEEQAWGSQLKEEGGEGVRKWLLCFLSSVV